MNSLLVFDIALSLEEDFIDCLLEFSPIESFSSFEIRRHGNHESLSTIEKVTGRSRAIRFEVVVDKEQIAQLVSRLNQAVAPNLRYNILPILGSGST